MLGQGQFMLFLIFREINLLFLPLPPKKPRKRVNSLPSPAWKTEGKPKFLVSNGCARFHFPKEACFPAGYSGVEMRIGIGIGGNTNQKSRGFQEKNTAAFGAAVWLGMD